MYSSIGMPGWPICESAAGHREWRRKIVTRDVASHSHGDFFFVCLCGFLFGFVFLLKHCGRGAI